MQLTKEELADKFIQAGHAKVSIDPEDLEVLGIKMQKTFKSKNGIVLRINTWESLCAFVYEKIMGEPYPGCRLRGSEFRSQRFGKDVAKAIRFSSEKDAAAQALANIVLSCKINPLGMEKQIMPRESEEKK